MEVRLIRQLPKCFGPGSVICLNPLGNCIVDLVFQIAGLADLQSLCVHRDDLSGTELMVFGLPRDSTVLGGQPGSPASENYLFSSVGLTCQRKLSILQCRTDQI